MKHLTINGLTWAVHYVEQLHEKLNFDRSLADGYRLGVTRPHDLKIYIDKSLPLNLLKRVIRHEITHAYLFSYGLDDQKWDEEELCKFIEYNIDKF